MKIRKMCEIGLFTAIISVCAWINVPTPVPFTLQTFAVFAVAFILGGKYGLISTAVYILLGAVGLPVFSGFRGGIGTLAGATGGYIIGFLFIPLLIWAFEKNRTKVSIIISSILGLLTCYAFGSVWFGLLYMINGKNITVLGILSSCVLPFILPDIIKILLAYAVSTRVLKTRRQ